MVNIGICASIHIDKRIKEIKNISATSARPPRNGLRLMASVVPKGFRFSVVFIPQISSTWNLKLVHRFYDENVHTNLRDLCSFGSHNEVSNFLNFSIINDRVVGSYQFIVGRVKISKFSSSLTRKLSLIWVSGTWYIRISEFFDPHHRIFHFVCAILIHFLNVSTYSRRNQPLIGTQLVKQTAHEGNSRFRHIERKNFALKAFFNIRSASKRDYDARISVYSGTSAERAWSGHVYTRRISPRGKHGNGEQLSHHYACRINAWIFITYAFSSFPHPFYFFFLFFFFNFLSGLEPDEKLRGNIYSPTATESWMQFLFCSFL